MCVDSSPIPSSSECSDAPMRLINRPVSKEEPLLPSLSELVISTCHDSRQCIIDDCSHAACAILDSLHAALLSDKEHQTSILWRATLQIDTAASKRHCDAGNARSDGTSPFSTEHPARESLRTALPIRFDPGQGESIVSVVTLQVGPFLDG